MRQKIILQRLDTSKKITLHSRDTFPARYERTSRRNLPRNITDRRTREIGPKKQWKRRTQLHKSVTVRRTKHTQKGGSFLSSGPRKLSNLGMKSGAKNLFNKRIDVGSRAITSEIGKKLIDERIKDAPELYRIGTSKTKNKNLKKVLESDAGKYIVEETRKKAKK